MPKRSFNMKKIATLLTAAALAATIPFGFSACGVEGVLEDVRLMAVDATAVGTVDTCDYFVAAEPAATTRANATGLNFVGDLQSLYGSDNGYPQAVIVAKNEIITQNPYFLEQFMTELEVNEEWLATAPAQTVIDAVASHLPEGTTPTFNAKNLTSQVISNCGIHFVDALADKNRVTNFLEEMAEVDPTSVGEVSETFFCQGLDAYVSDPGEVSIYAPDGAPALALAKLMAEENQFGQISVEYNIVPADTIGARVTGEDPAADICILPLNAASRLLGSGQTYKMLGTVTNGNLYILSKDDEQITADNIVELLNGKTVGVIQLANVPGLTLKIILQKYVIPYDVVG